MISQHNITDYCLIIRFIPTLNIITNLLNIEVIASNVTPTRTR